MDIRTAAQILKAVDAAWLALYDCQPAPGVATAGGRTDVLPPKLQEVLRMLDEERERLRRITVDLADAGQSAATSVNAAPGITDRQWHTMRQRFHGER